MSRDEPDVLRTIAMRVEVERERVVTTFADKDVRTTFEPDRVLIEKKDGTLIESRDEPERSFTDQPPDAPWDDVQVAYFSGEALWTYLNTPFLYTQPDFVTEEIAPVDADGEKWRRLRVTFPTASRATPASRSRASVRTACCAGTTTRWTSWQRYRPQLRP